MGASSIGVHVAGRGAVGCRGCSHPLRRQGDAGRCPDPKSCYRGAAKTGSVSPGLHTLPPPGAPSLHQRLSVSRLAQVLFPRVPPPLHPPSRRYGNTGTATSTATSTLCPPAPSPSLSSPHCPEQLQHHWQPPSPEAGMGQVRVSGMEHGGSETQQGGDLGCGTGRATRADLPVLPLVPSGCTSPPAAPLGVAEKPGACPAAAPEGLFYPCSFRCQEDKDCLGSQKCCPLGCGPACVEPAQGKVSRYRRSHVHRDSHGSAGRSGLCCRHLPSPRCAGALRRPRAELLLQRHLRALRDVPLQRLRGQCQPLWDAGSVPPGVPGPR